MTGTELLNCLNGRVTASLAPVFLCGEDEVAEGNPGVSFGGLLRDVI
jgi:hypothetical protein